MTGTAKKTTFFLLIQIMIILLNTQFSFCRDRRLGLYQKTDAVIILDNSNFEKQVFGSESAWLVEYYNSWCGHCIKFAPTFRKLAASLKGWRPVVSIGAIDCANENNTDICREHDVKAFPSFKLFKPYASKKDIGEDFHNQKPSELKEAVVDYVSNGTAFKSPAHWPKLTPIISMEEIWDETKDDHKHVAFIFEKEDSYLGRQVILDTMMYKPLLVRRMVKGAVKKFGITAFPSLYLINRDGTFTRLAKFNNTRQGMVDTLVSLLSPEDQAKGGGPVGNHLGTVHSNEPESEYVDSDEDVISPGVYMRDLESTLHYCFRQEIAINREIDGEKLLALIQFVNVLAKYFPGRQEVVHYLQSVMVWLRGMGRELTGDQWLSSIDDLQTVTEYLPEKVEWVGCHGSENRYRGYPCGMWTLFHALTVSAAQRVRENPRDLPLDVLGAIKGYMKYFFGCQVCVTHFLKMTESITSAEHEPKAAALWLWRAHNKANARLAGDKSEDPKHPKVQFPPDSLCPHCYDNKGEMVEEKVFTFLLGFYGEDGIHSAEDSAEEDGQIGSQGADGNKVKSLDWWERHQRKKDLEKIHELRLHKMKKTKQKKELRQHGLTLRQMRFKGNDNEVINLKLHSRGWGISNLDMGMCVFFYVLCTFIILLLYYHFIVRRKYKPSMLFTSKHS